MKREDTASIERKAEELAAEVRARQTTLTGAEESLRWTAEGLTDRREEMWALFDHGLARLHDRIT